MVAKKEKQETYLEYQSNIDKTLDDLESLSKAMEKSNTFSKKFGPTVQNNTKLSKELVAKFEELPKIIKDASNSAKSGFVKKEDLKVIQGAALELDDIQKQLSNGIAFSATRAQKLLNKIEGFKKVIGESTDKISKMIVPLNIAEKNLEYMVDDAVTFDKVGGQSKETFKKLKNEMIAASKEYEDLLRTETTSNEQLEKQKKKIVDLNSAYKSLNTDANKTLDLLEDSNNIIKKINEDSDTFVGSTGEIRRQYEEIVKKTSDTKKELDQMTESENISLDVIKAKKKELDSLEDDYRSLTDAQGEGKKLEQQTFSQMKKRAKIEQDILKAHTKKMRAQLKEKKNIRNLVEWTKAEKAQLQASVKAAFEMNIALMAVKKTVQGIVAAMAPLLGPLLALAAVAVIVEKLAEADKRVNEARRSIVQMAASTGAWNSTISSATENLAGAGSQVEIIRQQNAELATKLKTTTEEITQWEVGLTNVGFKLKDTVANLEDVSALSMRTGMDFAELTSSFDEARVNLGGTLTTLKKGFAGLISSAEASGMTMSRFYNKVINAASGLGIYGTKLTDVGKLFGSLVKSMKLPEKESTEIATEMIQSWEKMGIAERALVVEHSKVGQSFAAMLPNLAKGNVSLADFAKTLGKNVPKAGSEEEKDLIQLQKRFQTMAQQAVETGQSFSTVSEMLSFADPEKRIQAQYQAFLKDLGVNTEQSSAEVTKALQKKVAEFGGIPGLATLGEKFGLGSTQVLQGMLRQFENISDKFPKLNYEEALNQFGDSQSKSQKKQSADAVLAEARLANRRILAQTKPITDAIDQGITQAIDSMYVGLVNALMSIQKFLIKWFGSSEDYAKILKEEQEIQVNQNQKNLIQSKENIKNLKEELSSTTDPEQRDKLLANLVKQQEIQTKAQKEQIALDMIKKKYDTLDSKASKKDLEKIDIFAAEARSAATKTKEERSKNIVEKFVRPESMEGQIRKVEAKRAVEVQKEITQVFPKFTAPNLNPIAPSPVTPVTSVGLGSTPPISVPTTTSSTSSSQVINDNRTIITNINDKSNKKIEQVVRNTAYSDKIKP